MFTHCTHLSVQASICARVYCVYVRFHVCTSMCTGVPCACICIAHRACMPTYVCPMHVYTCAHNARSHTCALSCVCTCVYAHMCKFTHVHTHACACMCVCVLCACACVCTHNCSLHFALLEGGAESAPHPLPPKGSPSQCLSRNFPMNQLRSQRQLCSLLESTPRTGRGLSRVQGKEGWGTT